MVADSYFNRYNKIATNGNRKSVSQNKMCKIKLKLNSLMKSDDLQRIIQAAVSVGGQPF